MHRLKGYASTPPGGFPYTQVVGGKPIRLQTTFDIDTDAKTLADLRKGNGLPGGTFAQALQDIDEYTCLRLGGMSDWCWDPDVPYADTSPKLRHHGGCSTCGAKVK